MGDVMMDWELIFTSANRFAIVCWLVLAFAPARDKVLPYLLYLGCGLLTLTYTVLIIPMMAGMIDAGAPPGAAGGTPDFNTLAGVMALFDSKGGTTIGWIHYLAFDLFVGIWVSRNADRRGIHRLVQIPVLFLTLMFGPIGLLLYLILRQFIGRPQENALVPH
jgi:Domain of unknown function (DUF4281)